MERWVNRVALVTGASAGIGAAISKLLCQNGMKVVGCARRVENIQQIKDEGCSTLYPYKCDLSKEDDIVNMFKWIEDHPDLGKIDVCIPNAGYSVGNLLLEGSMEEWRGMLDVNVLSLQLCTQLAIKSMLKNKIDDGQVILVNSMSGHRVAPGPTTRFYTATKFAVTALLEGWRQEVRALGNNNIRVGQLSPGFVETEFVEKNLRSKEEADKLYKTMDCLTGEDMADCLKFILSAPPRMQIHDILVRPTRQQF